MIRFELNKKLREEYSKKNINEFNKLLFNLAEDYSNSKNNNDLPISVGIYEYLKKAFPCKIKDIENEIE